MATVTSMTASAIQSRLDLKADAATALVKDNNLDDVQDKSVARENLNLAQRFGIDVRDYGAIGDAIANDTTAIQNALNAALPGTTVYLSGTHYVNAPLTIPPQVRLAGMNSAHLDPAARPSLVPGGTFSGAAVLLLVDQTTGGYSRVSNEQHISNLSIDFGSVPGANVFDGIQVQGFVPGGVLDNVSVNDATGYGVNFVSNTSGVASSWRGVRVSVTFSNNYGINATINDSTWIDCEVKNGAGNGWQVGSAINSTFVGCRADNNSLNGFYFDSGDGSGNYVGGPIFVACTTNRNGQHGVTIPVAANGKTPISFTGCRFQRDGSSSTSAGYAGVSVNASTQPIVLTGCQVSPGVNSDGTGNNSPQYGLSVASGNVRVNGGIWHAVIEGIHDGGSNTYFKRGIDVLERTGTTGAPVDVIRGVQTTDTNNGSLDVPGNLAGAISPSGHGAFAWVYDPAAANISGALTSGVLYLSTIFVAKKTTAIKLFWHVQTAGATPTSGRNFIGLYNASGSLVASVGIDARVTTTGLFTETISAAVAPGKYRVAWLCNATTGPSVSRRNLPVDASLANFGLATTDQRFATYSSGLIALPATLTLASLIPSNVCNWAALADH